MARSEGFTCSVSKPVRISKLSREEGEPFRFDFSTNPIPADVTDLSVSVVFRGTLGHKADEAVAVGTSDVNEPQHLIFWNNTDYFLLKGVPCKAEEIEDHPGVRAYGYIYPYEFTETIAFAATPEELASAPASFSIENLPPARHSRVIAIMPGGSRYWVRDHIHSTPFASFPDQVLDNSTYRYPFPGATNQEAETGEWLNTPVYTVRGITGHQMTYFLRDSPEFIYDPHAFAVPEENNLGPYPVTIPRVDANRGPSGGWTAGPVPVPQSCCRCNEIRDRPKRYLISRELSAFGRKTGCAQGEGSPKRIRRRWLERAICGS
jgi:hypothetical protein